MTREQSTAEIEKSLKDSDLTIIRSARFKKHPLKAAYFYSLVAINRYTPLLLPIKASTLWGHKFIAYETSSIGSVYFLGFYDSEITLFLLKHFREEGDLLDIGANIGLYTSLFTQIAKPEAKIVSFEPTPSTFALLKKNVAGLTNVSCEAIAMSDSNGTTTFYDYGYQHGVFNSTAKQPLAFLKDRAEQISVQTETLDTWCERTGSKPSLIKLDTEGTESEILSKSSNTLNKFKPLILLEVGGGEAWSKNNNDSLDILAGHGYQFYTVSGTGETVPHARQDSYQYTNLVAIHSSKVSMYVAGN